MPSAHCRKGSCVSGLSDEIDTCHDHIKLAELILSDCGCSTINNDRLLHRVAARITCVVDSDIDKYRADAARYRWLRSRGAAHSKMSSSAVILKDKLNAKMAFRYWCTPEELDTAIDQRITTSTTLG